MIQFGNYFIVANRNGFTVKACVKSVDRKTMAEKSAIKPIGSFGTFTTSIKESPTLQLWDEFYPIEINS